MGLAFVHQFKEIVEYLDIAVIGESEVADGAPGLLVLKVCEDAVVEIAAVKGFHASHADGVEQEVVHIVGAEVSERVLEHLDRLLVRPRGGVEVGELRGNIVRITGIARQSLAYGLLGSAFAVGRRRVVVVDAVLHGVIYRAVDGFLVNGVVVSPVAHADGGEAHASVAQERDGVARIVVDAHGHRAVTGAAVIAAAACGRPCAGGYGAGSRNDA